MAATREFETGGSSTSLVEGVRSNEIFIRNKKGLKTYFLSLIKFYYFRYNFNEFLIILMIFLFDTFKSFFIIYYYDCADNDLLKIN